MKNSRSRHGNQNSKGQIYIIFYIFRLHFRLWAKETMLCRTMLYRTMFRRTMLCRSLSCRTLSFAKMTCRTMVRRQYCFERCREAHCYSQKCREEQWCATISRKTVPSTIMSCRTMAYRLPRFYPSLCCLGFQ